MPRGVGRAGRASASSPSGGRAVSCSSSTTCRCCGRTRGARRARRARRRLPARDHPGGRVARRPGVARSRGCGRRGRVTELGPADLAMDLDETAALLRLAGLEPGAADAVGAVVAHRGLAGGRRARRAVPRRSLGARSGRGLRWRRPAGRRLRARRGPSRAAGRGQATAAGDRRSSTRCPARSCDHVLERTGSAAALSDLAREHGVLIRLDRSDERFRHHRLDGRDAPRRAPARASPSGRPSFTVAPGVASPARETRTGRSGMRSRHARSSARPSSCGALRRTR